MVVSRIFFLSHNVFKSNLLLGLLKLGIFRVKVKRHFCILISSPERIRWFRLILNIFMTFSFFFVIFYFFYFNLLQSMLVLFMCIFICIFWQSFFTFFDKVVHFLAFCSRSLLMYTVSISQSLNTV